jgi:hypothetical protein
MAKSKLDIVQLRDSPKGGEKRNKDADDLFAVEQSNLSFPSSISFSDQ